MDQPGQDFAEFLTDLDHGSVNDELSKELAAIVERVEETGKAGTLTLTLTVKKEGQMAVVDVKHTAKAPTTPIHGTLFFFAGKGRLTREDPRQLRLRELAPVKPVAGGEDR